MKIALIGILFALHAFAADPEPLPPARREEVSAQLLSLKDAQLDYFRAKQAFEESIQRVKAQQESWNAYLAALGKEFHAEGCTLAADKSWKCPAQEKQ